MDCQSLQQLVVSTLNAEQDEPSRLKNQTNKIKVCLALMHKQFGPKNLTQASQFNPFSTIQNLI